MTQGLPYPSPTPATGQITPNPSPTGQPSYATMAVTPEGFIIVASAAQQTRSPFSFGVWGSVNSGFPKSVNWF